MADEIGEDAEAPPEPLTSVQKALALASLGIKVFPVHPETRAPMLPGEGGVYKAVSDDFELIATWFTIDYPNAVVGVWTGGSGLLTGDVDRGKKNGNDGFKALADAGLSMLNGPVQYATPHGGEHHIWNTERTDLTSDTDVKYKGNRLKGVDVRAGGSYMVWWGDTVPDSRAEFDGDIPEWLVEAAQERKAELTTVGYTGSIAEWLEHIEDDIMPSMRVAALVSRIPKGDFGHAEMTDMAWNIVRMGSERETGIKLALDNLRTAWLRAPYDTPKYRRDFENAIKGAILKGGRLQKPVPTIAKIITSMDAATKAGVDDQFKRIERMVSGNPTISEVDLARARRDMFKIAAKAGLTPSVAMGLVTGSSAFLNSVASIESTWYGDGEPEYHEAEEVEEEEEEEREIADAEAKLAKMLTNFATDAESFTFLTEAETTFVDDPANSWWGETDYLPWIKKRIKHFNRPYHVGAMFGALSVIASGWGRVPLPGAEPTNCNLYLMVLGESTSGKSEAWAFGKGLISAYYGKEHSPIVGDAKKSTALSLHRTLIMRDGKPTMIASDEVQAFFEDLKYAKWQGSILGDMSDWYGGEVSPKNTMNDKEISGKSARTILTAYLTGIADMTLDAVGIGHWRSGLFYRYIWGFGHPRGADDFKFRTEKTIASYTAEYEAWAKEFKRVGALNEMMGLNRLVLWEEDAEDRMSEFNEQMNNATKSHPLHAKVFRPSNTRFSTSIAKVATLIALVEVSEKVTLRHVLLALKYAGPWHRSMVLAVNETGKEPFERQCDEALEWIRENAIKQVGKPPVIQRSAVMRAFKPNEVAERMLRQLTEEGYLFRSADTYEVVPEEK